MCKTNDKGVSCSSENQIEYWLRSQSFILLYNQVELGVDQKKVEDDNYMI